MPSGTREDKSRPHGNRLPAAKKLLPITGWISQDEYSELIGDAVARKVSFSQWVRRAIQDRLKAVR